MSNQKQHHIKNMKEFLQRFTQWLNLTKTKKFVITSVLAAAVAVPLLIPVHGDDDSDRSANSELILGTWILQVSLDPASVPPGSVLNFTVVPTFSAGGGLVQGETGNGPGGRGDSLEAHGNWVKTGPRQYAATSRAPDFDDAHQFTGERKVKDTFIVNKRGDELVGAFKLDLSLADGTILPFHPAGTYTGVRMPIEPLN
jgi:hypothetical protein